ncbi:hypothetical protein EJB05_00504, partial [Eragrostis curvula]
METDIILESGLFGLNLRVTPLPPPLDKNRLRNHLLGRRGGGASGDRRRPLLARLTQARPVARLVPSLPQCFAEAEVRACGGGAGTRVARRHSFLHEATTIAAATAVPLHPPTTETSGSGEDAEAAAAIKIQSAFGSSLVRHDSCATFCAEGALRGMVKLQAMVRG